MTAAPAPAASRFAAMDGLRGAAALLVLVFHYTGAIAREGKGPQLAPSAYLAVDLFFMLSGFVIALAYEERLRAGLGLWRFAWIRFARLYPLALLGTLISVAALAAPGLWPSFDGARLRWVTLDAVRAALFIPHMRGDSSLFPLNPPMWSLLLEIAINLGYAAALPWLSNRMLAVVAALGGAGVVAVAFSYGHLDLGATTLTRLGGLARVTWGFPVGVLLYRWWRRGSLDRLPRCPAWLLPVVFTLICAPTYRGRGSPFALSLAVLLALPILTALAAGARVGARERPLLHWLGLISFPVYAVHWAVLNAARAVSGDTLPVAAAAVAAPIALAASWLSLRWWDDPIRARLARVGRVRPATVTAAPPL